MFEIWNVAPVLQLCCSSAVLRLCCSGVHIELFRSKMSPLHAVTVLQCVEVWCTLLQCVTAGLQLCCNVLLRVAACCSALQRVAVCCSMFQFIAVCCSMPFWIAQCTVVCACVCSVVCCSVLQGSWGETVPRVAIKVLAVRCSVLYYVAWKYQGLDQSSSSALQRVAVCYSVIVWILQCVAVRCSVL